MSDIEKQRAKRWADLLSGKTKRIREEARAIMDDGLGEVYALRADWTEAIAIVEKLAKLKFPAVDAGTCPLCGGVDLMNGHPIHLEGCVYVASRELLGLDPLKAGDQ